MVNLGGIDSNQANMVIVIQDYRITINYAFDIGSFMVIAGQAGKI